MTGGQVAQPTPPWLIITPWADQVVEAGGHRPASPYIEAVWLGTLGPSTIRAWQRLARIATTKPGLSIDTADLAVSLGLGDSLSRNAKISRTLSRLMAFDAAHLTAESLAVRVALPDITERQAARLSPSARFAHNHLARRATVSSTDTGLPEVYRHHLTTAGGEAVVL